MLTTRLLALAVVFAAYDVTHALMSLDDCEADIVFVIDNSQSIAGYLADYRPNEIPEHYPSKNWRRVLTFSNNLVSNLNVRALGSHVAAVDFGDDAALNFDFNGYSTQADVQAAIAKIPYKAGYTYTDKGLKMAYDLFTNPTYGKRDETVEKILILITDGQPTNQAAVQPEVDRLKALRIRMVVVFIAPTDAIRAKEPLVRPIATRDRDYIRLNSFAELETYDGTILNEETCTRPPAPTLPPPEPTTLPPPPATTGPAEELPPPEPSPAPAPAPSGDCDDCGGCDECDGCDDEEGC